ncbi:complement decay-accelerating factor isoform X2 [Larimichthys crocea]|uniref:complement decay-accelerating factor isoform X2 n=1 Tax=Larimichthys crocea TaxID=215358 RepID=UPI000F5DAFE0|nr:complement decay-accelerating factor isoform X2 [Larimichthys crocea]
MDILLDTCGRRRVKSLLMMYLFVVNAAAECPKPHEWENMVLTNEALLLNEFPEGSEVTVECGNGYIKESGTGIVNCINGNWNNPDLNCKKTDCGHPKPQPNMSFNTSGGTLFGAVIKVFCDKGYQLSGSSYKRCYATGWFGRSNCKIVTCAKPGEIDNGRNNWVSEDRPKYGEIIQYVCNDGYSRVGTDKIACNEIGQYDFPPPECKSVTTEDTITTKMVTPTSTPQAQDPSTTPTVHRDKTITTSATQTDSTPAQGGRVILTAEDKATTTSVTPTTSFQDGHDEIVDINKNNGHIILAVTLAFIFVLVGLGLILYRFLLKRKGSYDTREDLKPELLQFQNL